MVPFVDLKLQFELFREDFQRAFLKVCLSGEYILGSEVTRFEKRFGEFLGVKEAVGVATGTDALHLALRALDVKPGDEILVPANTFIASAIGVYGLGGIPVPVDVDPDTYLMDLRDAETRVTKRTKGVMPVHLYGQSMDMEAVLAFSNKHNLFVIEDACQAHGGKWKEQRVGSFGIAGCFSFYPSKNLGAFGDGGLVAANDPGFAEKIRLLRNYGSKKKYVHDTFGTNSRLDSIHAAILNVKLDFLDEWNAKRFLAACRYVEGLKGVNEVQVPVFDRNDKFRHVFHLFVIQCDRRDELISHLEKRNIQCGVHYPVPIYLHKAFESLGFKKGMCPITERLSGRILSLPIFPEITHEQIDTVLDAVREFYG